MNIPRVTFLNLSGSKLASLEGFTQSIQAQLTEYYLEDITACLTAASLNSLIFISSAKAVLPMDRIPININTPVDKHLILHAEAILPPPPNSIPRVSHFTVPCLRSWVMQR